MLDLQIWYRKWNGVFKKPSGSCSAAFLSTAEKRNCRVQHRRKVRIVCPVLNKPRKEKPPRHRRWFLYNKCSCRTKTKLESKLSCPIWGKRSGWSPFGCLQSGKQGKVKLGLFYLLCSLLIITRFPFCRQPKRHFAQQQRWNQYQAVISIHLLSRRRKLVASSK